MQIWRLIGSLQERLPNRLATKLEPLLARDITPRDSDHSAAQTMAVTAFVVRMISAAIAFFSHILFARLIGQFDYGIYAFVWVLVVIFGNLACLGFHTTLIRYLPLYNSQQDDAHYRGLTFASKLTAVAAACSFAIIGALTLHFLGDKIDQYYLVPAVLGLLCLPLIALGDMLDGTARANAWPLAAMQFTYLIRPLLVILMMIAAIAFGFEKTATTAMQAALVACLLTSLIQLTAIQRRLKQRVSTDKAQFDYGKWLRFALPMFFIDGIGFLLTNADVIFVGLYLPPDQVAIYFAAAKTIVLMQFVFFAVKAAAGPHFAKLIANANGPGLKQAASQIARWSFWPSLAVGIILLGIGPWLLALFGKGFTSGYSLIVILFFGLLIKSSIGPAETLLNMAGKQFICVWLYAIIFLINVTLNVILLPRYGLEGAAIATSLAMAIETVLLFGAVRYQLGIWLNPLPERNAVRAVSGAKHGQ